MESPTKPSNRILLFDRRYGWVLDEWKEPSQEALSGGRGMFCILPLAKAFLDKASESMNFVANSIQTKGPWSCHPKIKSSDIVEAGGGDETVSRRSPA